MNNNRYLLLCLLASTSLNSHAQVPIQGIQAEKVFAADGSPALVTFRAEGKHYGAGEAARALREQLQLLPDEQMVRTKVETDELGFIHEKYQQYYRGVKVEHATYSVHSKAQVIESLSGHISHLGQLDVSPKVSAAAALVQALASVGAKEYMWQIPQEEEGLKRRENNPAATYKPQGELVLVAESSSRESKKPKLVAAWKFDIYAHEPLSRAYLYVDAQTGGVVLQDAILKHLGASFATRYSGTRTVETEANPGGGFRLRDLTRGSGIITLNCQKSTFLSGAVDFVDNDNNWTAAEYDNTNFDNAAGDAQFGAEATFDYWLNVHGRNGWNNAGGQLRSYVHYGSGIDNAYWDGSQMLYGDGSVTFNPLTSLDVTGHEIGHGVCQTTANLTYSGESGALNEGFSDIWGACVEQNAAAAFGLTKSTWLIGEEIVKTGPALRSMNNPKSLGQPSYYQGQNWYTGSSESVRVHTNSGVINHWFYILSQGEYGTNEVSNFYSVTGVGINSAARIAYRAEAQYLSAGSGYADARTFTVRAAQDLFGTCSPEVVAVTNAWFAVGVGDRVPLIFFTSGPSSLCAGDAAVYTANTANVTWSASPSNLFNVTTGSGSQFSTSTPYGVRGTGTITMTSCGQTNSKNVQIGSPEPSGTYSCGYSPSYSNPVTLSSYQSLGITNPEGGDVGVFLDSPYTFSFTADLAGLYLTQTTGTSTHFILKPGQGVTITATSTNAPCTIVGRYAFLTPSGGYRIAAAPNPVSIELTVKTVDDNSTANAPVNPATPPFDADLYDSYGKKVKTQHSDHGKAVLDVSNLPNGLYNLRAGTGTKAITEHIEIAH